MEVLEMLDKETAEKAPAFPLRRLPSLLFLAFLCSPLLLEAQARPDSAAGDAPPKDEEQVAAIPDWSPADPEIAQTYQAGRAALDEHDYAEAKKQFRKLRTKVRGTDGEEAVTRCLMEAEGGLLCEKGGEIRREGATSKDHRSLAQGVGGCRGDLYRPGVSALL